MKGEDSTAVKPLAMRPSPMVELITAAQRRNDWTDEELERHLRVDAPGVAELVRRGVVQLSYGTALSIEAQLGADPMQLLFAYIETQAAAVEQAVLSMYTLLKIDPATQRISNAYDRVLQGDNRVVVLKLPQAKVWVVPDGVIRAEEGEEAKDMGTD